MTGAAIFLHVVCLTCRSAFQLMGETARAEHERTAEAWCPVCHCYRPCQRVAENNGTGE
jgi:hypothetical protein